MHGFPIDAVAFLLVIWAVAFLAACARALADDSYSSLGRLVGLASTAGFVAVGLTGLICGDPSSVGFNRLWYVGAASIIGGLGKEQDDVRKFCLRFIQGIKVSAEGGKQ